MDGKEGYPEGVEFSNHTPTSSILPHLNEMTHFTEDEIVMQLRSRIFELEAENESLRYHYKHGSAQHPSPYPDIYNFNRTPSPFSSPFQKAHVQLESLDSIAKMSEAASDVIMMVDNNLNLVHTQSVQLRHDDHGGAREVSELAEVNEQLKERNEYLEDKLKMFEQNLLRLQDSVMELDVQRVAAESCLQVALKQIELQKGSWVSLNPLRKRTQIFGLSKEQNQLLEAKLELKEREGSTDNNTKGMLMQDKLVLENKLLRHEMESIRVEMDQLKSELEEQKNTNAKLFDEKRALFERFTSLQKVVGMRMGEQRPSPADILEHEEDEQ